MKFVASLSPVNSFLEAPPETELQTSPAVRSKPNLKAQPQAEAELALVGPCGRHREEVRGRPQRPVRIVAIRCVRTRVVEVRRVGEIHGLGAELNLQPFCRPESPEQTDIDIAVSGTPQAIPPGCTETFRRPLHGPESTGIEKGNPAPDLAKLLHLRFHLIGNLGIPGCVQRCAVGGDGKWPSAVSAEDPVKLPSTEHNVGNAAVTPFFVCAERQLIDRGQPEDVCPVEILDGSLSRLNRGVLKIDSTFTAVRLIPDGLGPGIGSLQREPAGEPAIERGLQRIVECSVPGDVKLCAGGTPEFFDQFFPSLLSTRGSNIQFNRRKLVDTASTHIAS